jgi:hypothetical protein
MLGFESIKTLTFVSPIKLDKYSVPPRPYYHRSKAGHVLAKAAKNAGLDLDT